MWKYNPVTILEHQRFHNQTLKHIVLKDKVDIQNDIGIDSNKENTWWEYPRISPTLVSELLGLTVTWQVCFDM